MRAIIQRVSQASVTVNKNTVGEIAHGFLILLGITHSDTAMDADWIVGKISKLRIFEDDDGKLNKNITNVEGSILLVSQFTLYGNCKKGNRPSFMDAARPEQAKPMYEYVIAKLQEAGITVETGSFGEYMKVSLVNDGPTTILLDSPVK